MKMNNGPTPRWQRMRRLGAAFFFADFDRRSNDEEHPYDGNDPTIRAYRYTITAFGNPEANSTYEDRLLHLIQHEADKMDSSRESNINTTANTDHNEGGIL